MQYVLKRAQRSASIVLGCEDVTLIDVILIEIQNGIPRALDELNVSDFARKIIWYVQMKKSNAYIAIHTSTMVVSESFAPKMKHSDALIVSLNGDVVDSDTTRMTNEEKTKRQ